jgi:hypothetical protein
VLKQPKLRIKSRRLSNKLELSKKVKFIIPKANLTLMGHLHQEEVLLEHRRSPEKERA